MTIQNYLMIQENIVINVCLWDGDVNTWQPPLDVIMLIQANTPAMVWKLDTNLTPSDFVLAEEIGVGQIGFAWDGTFCVTNEPKPIPPTANLNQPIATGTTTI